jgi:hypothetical protein
MAWDDNIITYFGEKGGVDVKWNETTQSRVQWRALVLSILFPDRQSVSQSVTKLFTDDSNAVTTDRFTISQH